MFVKISAILLILVSFISTKAMSAPPPEVAAVHVMTEALLALKESKSTRE